MSGSRDRVDSAIGAVLFKASNFPERVKAHVLGQNMAPLREKLTTAVLAALGICGCVEDVVCVTCMTRTTPPANDVREALARTIWTAEFAFSHPGRTPIVQWEDVPTSPSRQKARAQADAIIAAEVRPHGTVTDAEVEAGAWALLDRGMDLADRNPTQQVYDEAKADARAVLEAAREVHP